MKKIILLLFAALIWNALNAQTVSFQWAKQMSGALDDDDLDEGHSIATDAKGNVYTTGAFVDTLYFSTGTGAYGIISAGGYDSYVSKFDSSGNFIWAKPMGGPSDDYGYSIAVDGRGNVYTTGFFQDTADFNPGVSACILSSSGLDDVFISKLDSSGNFAWAKKIGGVTEDRGNAIALDGSNNIYTTGYFSDTVDFDPGTGTYNLVSLGQNDIFISKLDSLGNFLWAKRIGGTNDYGIGNAIAIDNSANVYTTGYFAGTLDFDPGTGSDSLTSAGSYDVFISKLDSAGNFIWAKQMSGATGSQGNSIAVDAFGNSYTAGYFAGTIDFDPGTGADSLTSSGFYDIFIAKLNAAGNFAWAKQMGGTAMDLGASITLDAGKNVYTTGSFFGSADFNPGIGSDSLLTNGFDNVFISKLDSSGNFVWAKQMGGTSGSAGTDIATDQKGNIYTVGIFKDTLDIDPGAGIYNLSSVTFSIFVQKLSQALDMGINENTIQNSIAVFPNPSTDRVNLLLDKPIDHASISLINMMGQTVIEKTNLSGNRFTLDMSGQASGFYLLEIKEKGDISRVKLVKN